MLVTGWFLFPQARMSNTVGRTQAYVCVPKVPSSTQSWPMKDRCTLETSEVSLPVFFCNSTFQPDMSWSKMLQMTLDLFLTHFDGWSWWPTWLHLYPTKNPSCCVFLWGASLIRVFRAERPCLNLFSAHMKGSRRSFCSLPIVLNSCWQVHLPCCGSCAAGMKSNFFRIPT